MWRTFWGAEELANLEQVIVNQNGCRQDGGEFVPRFEKAFGEHIGRKYVYAVNSGTSANLSSYAGIGIGPGDEVIVPGFAPVFVSMPVVALGAIPVFADVDPATRIVTAETIKAAITPNAKAVVVVHVNGQPAQMDQIMQVARMHNLKVVEDCAQAYDAIYKGKTVGTIGDVACWSLQQCKHISSGEGGIVATDDEEIYQQALMMANVGMPWYEYPEMEIPTPNPVLGMPTRGHFRFGLNLRMSEFTAAVALAQLDKIEAFNDYRRLLVNRIRERLGGRRDIRLPRIYPHTVPNYWFYTIWGPPSLGASGEINYLEVVFQQMQRSRNTSVGTPIPYYVQYSPGLCPNAEKSVIGAYDFITHHGKTVDQIDVEIDDLLRRL